MVLVTWMLDYDVYILWRFFFESAFVIMEYIFISGPYNYR